MMRSTPWPRHDRGPLRSWIAAPAARLLLAIAVAGSIFAAPVARAGDEDPEPWLDHWAAALGGRERLAQEPFVHLHHGVNAHGLTGTMDDWYSADGRHRMELDLGGVFKLVQVNDGETVWSVDQNGKLSRMEGADLEAERSAEYLATWSALLPGRMKGSVEWVGTSEAGHGILRLSTPGGKPLTVHLDPESGLPVRIETPTQERTAVTTISDWVEYDGVLFPRNSRSSTGDHRYDMEFVLEEASFHAEADPAIFAKPEDQADDFRFTEGSPALGIPLELSPFHVFLQAEIDGKGPFWFILDTGASVTVLNESTAESLGLEMKGTVEGRGAGEGSIEVHFINGVDFSIPGVALEGQTVVAIDLDRIESLMGRPIDGIFGYDFISRFVVEIDYGDELLNLYAHGSFEPDGRGSTLPIEMDGSQPYVVCTIRPFGRQPIEARFLVDTGSGGALSFARPFTEQHDLIDTLPKRYEHIGGYGVGGASTMTVGRIVSLELGELFFQEPNCGFAHDQGGAGASPDEAGILGGRILRRCTVVFDYEQGRMILTPNDSYADPFPVNSSGLAFVTGGRGHFDEFEVLHVDAASPAEASGFEAGDRLLSIDGRPASEYTSEELGELLRGNAGTIGVEVERTGERKGLRLQLVPRI